MKTWLAKKFLSINIQVFMERLLYAVQSDYEYSAKNLMQAHSFRSCIHEVPFYDFPDNFSSIASNPYRFPEKDIVKVLMGLEKLIKLLEKEESDAIKRYKIDLPKDPSERPMPDTIVAVGIWYVTIGCALNPGIVNFVEIIWMCLLDSKRHLSEEIEKLMSSIKRAQATGVLGASQIAEAARSESEWLEICEFVPEFIAPKNSNE